MCVDFVAHLLSRDEEMALEPAGAIFQWLSFKNGFRQIFFSFSTVLMMGPSTRAYAKQLSTIELPSSLKYEIDFHSCDETIPGACTRWPSASLLTYIPSPDLDGCCLVKEAPRTEEQIRVVYMVPHGNEAVHFSSALSLHRTA